MHLLKCSSLFIFLISLLSSPPALAENFSATEWKTLDGYSEYVWDVEFSPNGNYFALTVGDNTIELYDKNWNKVWSYQSNASNGVGDIAFSPDEKYLAFARYQSRKDIALFRLSDKKVIQILIGHLTYVNNVSFSPDGEFLASGSWDNSIKIWQRSSGKFREVQTLTGHSEYVNSISFSSNDTFLASGSDDESVKIWQPSSGKFREVQTLTGHLGPVHNVSFSPDGKFLASGSWDRSIKIWQYGSGKFREVQTLIGHPNYVECVSFSPDGRFLASGSRDKSIKIWQRSGGEFREVQTLTGHSSGVRSISFSPDGKFLASGSNDRSVKIWKLGGVSGASNDVSHFQPPDLISKDVSFSESSNNDLLDADEKGKISFILENRGKGTAYSVAVQIENLSPEKDISFRSKYDVGNIEPNKKKRIEIEISAGKKVETSEVTFQISFSEANGFPADPLNVTFSTEAFNPPELVLTNLVVDDSQGNKNSRIEAAESIEVTVYVHNKGVGDAEKVLAQVQINNENIFPLTENMFDLGTIRSGAKKPLRFMFTVNKVFKGTKLPINLKISESKGKFGNTFDLNLKMNQTSNIDEYDFDPPPDLELYTLAILPIESEHLTEAQKRAFTGKLNSVLSGLGVAKIVESEHVDKILKQWAYMRSECVTDGFCKQFGELLGAEKLALCDITELEDDNWMINAKIIDVYDATTHSATDKCSCSISQLDQSIEIVGRDLGKWLAGQYED